MGKVQSNPYHGGGGPFPKFKRVMVFIDGENQIFRYQETLKQSRIPNDHVSHKSDVYVWSPESIVIDGLYEIERATLYTYTSGERNAVDAISNEIKSLNYKPHLGSQLPDKLFPKVFWKKKGTNGKGVLIYS